MAATMKQTLHYFLLIAALSVFGADAGITHSPELKTGDPEGVGFRLIIEDESSLLGEKAKPVTDNLLAAADLWSRCLKGRARIDLLVKFVPGAGGRATARCPGFSFVKKIGHNSLFETSACAKIRTGNAETDGKPDIEMVVYGDYLPKLWFDPAPQERTAPVAPDRVDAVSLFLHELAHGLGFTGWINPETGEQEREILSTFDRYIVHDQGEFYFVGLRAMKIHGGPVALSRRTSNYHHLGHETKDTPESLRTDLMNGENFALGHRYSISPLDLAILEDCGLPTKSNSR